MQREVAGAVLAVKVSMGTHAISISIPSLMPPEIVCVSIFTLILCEWCDVASADSFVLKRAIATDLLLAGDAPRRPTI